MTIYRVTSRHFNEPFSPGDRESGCALIVHQGPFHLRFATLGLLVYLYVFSHPPPGIVTFLK